MNQPPSPFRHLDDADAFDPIQPNSIFGGSTGFEAMGSTVPGKYALAAVLTDIESAAQFVARDAGHHIRNIGCGIE